MSKEELMKLVLEAQGQLIEKDRIIAEKHQRSKTCRSLSEICECAWNN
jgi:hypothetical protein